MPVSAIERTALCGLQDARLEANITRPRLLLVWLISCLVGC